MPPFRNNNLNNGINNSGLFPESNEISKEEVKDYLLDPIRVLGVSFLSVAMLITILAFVISYTLEYNVTNKKKELENGSVTKEIIGINLEDINNFYNKFRILQNKLQNKNNLFGVIDVLSVAVEENSYFSNFSWKADDKGTAEVTLSVESNGLESAIIQKDRFLVAVKNKNINNSDNRYDYSKSGIIKSVKVSPPAESEDGKYKYTITMTVDNKRRYDAIANELEQIRKDAVQEIIVKPKENNKNNPASPATSTTSSIINNSYNTNVASSTTQSVFNLVSTSSPLTNKPGLPALAPIPQKPNLLELYNNR